ncbi:putative 50S ribosomal subunit protein L35 [Candidatus Zinderia insecticola CARI]|uniref:50S ribosomal protein L35 n=1 Tax=Zinderia insecticola (strain CARI) TaxID=871271 RepID=E0TIN0_ZINIC|nr:putative 50S ribosomal subunit protein L35 [Candidatus Zinderia insecticola CARI]
MKKKTKSSVKKRFFLLKSGLIKKGKSFKKHILTKKKKKIKRKMKKMNYVNKNDIKSIKLMI